MDSNWFVFALLATVLLAISSAVAKKIISYRGMDCAIAGLINLCSGLFIGSYCVFMNSGAGNCLDLSLQAWLIALAHATLDVVSIIFWFEALAIAELSYVMTFMAVLNLFVMIPPFFLFGEKLTTQGVFGIILITIGSVIINWRIGKEGNKKAILFLLPVLICWTFTPSLRAYLIREKTPEAIGFILQCSTGILFLLPFFLKKEILVLRKYFQETGSSLVFWKSVLLLGVMSGLANLLNFSALKMTSVAYATVVGSTMPLFAFVIGYIYFKERDELKKKVLATVFMIAGSIFLVF